MAQTLAQPYPSSSDTALATRIRAILSAPAIAGAHWGIAVAALDGTPVYGLDESKLFRPASTAKLFTTAAALAVLGPDHRVKTEVYGDLDKTTGVVQGDLVLQGGGDPSFATDDLPYRAPDKLLDKFPDKPGAHTSDLVTFADQLAAQGLRTVTGSVVGRDDLFALPSAPEGWAAEDLVWGYGALPSALSVQDNEAVLTLRPPDAHVPSPLPVTQVTVQQLVPYLNLDNRVTTSPAEAKTNGLVEISLERQDPPTLVLTGSLPPGAAPIVEHVALPEPALYGAEALHQMLTARGIMVGGQARALHAAPEPPRPFLVTVRTMTGCGWAYPGEPANCALRCILTPSSKQLLATHTSPPLIDEVTFTLKTSANLHAELLLRQLALKNSCPGNTFAGGEALVRRFLLHLGIAEGDFVFYDGSGLSTKDLVTPRAEVQLLAWAAKQPWFPQWKAALPVGGRDGTLQHRFSQPPLQGNVFAKTGTLGESRTLAGYVRGASGRQLVFSILSDNHLPGSLADRVAMDDIVAAIAAAN